MKRLVSCIVLVVMALMQVFPAGAVDTGILPVAASGIVAGDGNTLYLADSYHRTVWRMEDGDIELIAGQTEVTDLSGQPVSGYRDCTFLQAAFGTPWAVVQYQGGLLVSDSENHVLRYLDLEKEKVYTAAGTGKAGYQDGSSRAAFDTPTGLAVGDDGTVYIADTGNNVIRVMDDNGKVTTYAGGEEGCALGNLKQVQFSEPTGLYWHDGVLYVADSGNHRIVAIEDDTATLVAGAELTGDAAVEGDYLDGKAELARFSNPQGIAVDADGTVYVADTGNSMIRKIENGYVTTLLTGEEKSSVVSPRGLWVNGDTLVVGDVFTHTLAVYDIPGLLTGWKKINNHWYYYDQDGTAQGWLLDNGNWYYLDDSGIMLTGWQRINGNWYYLKSSGAMATGWVKSNGKWYYLYDSGEMAVNIVIDGYRINANGEWIEPYD